MAKIFLDSNDNLLVSDDSVQVYGTGGSGSEVVRVAAGVSSITVDQAIERVVFSASTASLSFKQAGINLMVYSGTTLVATVPLQADGDGTLITTTDGTMSAKVAASSGGPVMTLGGATVSAGTAGAVTPVNVDTSLKAPTSPGVVTPPSSGQTFVLTADAATVNEGGTSFITLATTGVAAGSKYSYVVKGVSASDLAGGSIFGTAEVGADGKAIIGVSLAADAATEGDETMTVEMAGKSASVTVKDTSTAPVVPSTYTLTTSVDLLSGGAGADTFYGSIIDDLGTGTTLNPGDNINGGGGDDVLNLTISGNPTASTFLVQTTSVEQVNVGNYDTNNATDATLSMSSATGITGVAITGGNGDTSVTGLAALVALSNASGTGDMTVTYASGLLAGTADTQKVTLNNTGLSSDSVAVSITDAAGGGAETLEIASNGSANFVTLATATNYKTVTVKGDGPLTINADGETTVTTIDGSAMTKALTVTNLGASNIAITGGAGNDVIVGAFDSNDTVNAGAGTDSLGLAAAITAANAKNVTGFEALVLGDDVSQAVNAFTGITTLTVDHTAVDGSSDADAKTSAFTSAAGTEALAIRTQGTTDNVTVSLATNGTADSIAVTMGTATAGVTVAALDLDNYETITLTSGGATNTITDLTATSLKTLNIAGAKAIVIDANSTGSWNALKTVDASTATANVEFGALDAAGTITGGSGNDTFTGSGSADSISGGAGNDALTGGGGNDTLAGGDGSDTITATGASQDVITGGTGDDTITSATGNDNIDGGDGNDTFVINATDAATPVLDLSSADTLVGGAGTDTLRIDGTFTAARTIDLSGTTETRLVGVSGVEKITLSSATNETTLKVSDIVLGAFASGLTVDVASGNTLNHGVDASAVLNTSAKVTFNGNTGNNAYTVGNGVDTAALSSGTDTVTVGNILLLQASDVLGGGAGADTLKFTATGTTSVTTAQSAGVSGFETILIDTDDGSAYTVAINDAIVTANKDSSTDTLTITRDTTLDNGTLKIDASAITTGKLAINGGAGADTITGGTLADKLFGGAGADALVGGAGNDTIDGGAGIDTVTGGDGTDTYQLSAVTSNARDIISGFVAGATGEKVHLGSAIGGANVTLLSGSDDFASSASLQAFATAGNLTVAPASEVVIVRSGVIANNLALTAVANDLDGTNLLTAIGGTITVQANGNQHLFAVADQFGNVGLYYGDADADIDVAAAEIALVGVLQATSLSSLVFGNFSNGALTT